MSNDVEESLSEKKNFVFGKEIIKILASLLIPLVIALVGHWYTSALKEREIEARYIEIAISILNSESTPSNKNIRKWAVEIVNKYSPVEIDKKTRQEFVDKLTKYKNYHKHLQTLPSGQKLAAQIKYTRNWLDRYSLKASDLKKMLSTAGYFKGKIDDETLNQSLIDAVTAFQTKHLLNPNDGICGEDCYAKLKELGFSSENP